MKTTFYRHCVIRKKIPEGELQQHTWLPEQFAKIGKIIKIREDGVWNDGWEVKEASSSLLAEENLPNFYKDSKSHLRGTGDLPK